MNSKILGPLAVSALALTLAACGSSNVPVTDSSAPVALGSASSSAPTTEQSASGGGTGQVTPLPFNASGLLGGNAKPTFPDGEPGKVSVVQISPLDKDNGTVSFAFRNNTSEGISHVDWTVTATSGGKIVATGSSTSGIPAQVQPGEVGLSSIYLDNAKSIPKDAKYEFTVNITPADTSSYNTAPLKVTQATIVGGSLVGGATNETGAEVKGPYDVRVYCFKGDNILRTRGSSAEQNGKTAPGGKVTFSMTSGGDTCATFTVGVSGYFS
jgi:hypothetical protein